MEDAEELSRRSAKSLERQVNNYNIFNEDKKCVG